MIAAIVVAITALVSPAPAAGLAPAVRDGQQHQTVQCARTVFTAWGDTPPCDMDGTQTWVLAGHHLLRLGPPDEFCEDSGGTYAVSHTAPLTHYCIDIDY